MLLRLFIVFQMNLSAGYYTRLSDKLQYHLSIPHKNLFCSLFFNQSFTMVCMKILIIDTSGKEGYCALIENGTEVWSFTCQARDLVERLSEMNPTYEQIAIGTGPGSFTGTRIGVMAAKTLSYAQDIPLLPFNSLQLRKPNREGTLVRDARSNLYYTLNGLIDRLPEDAIDVDQEAPNIPHLLTQLGAPKEHQDVHVTYLKNP